jgi:hypothetical protein
MDSKPTHAYIGKCKGCNKTEASCAETPDLKWVGKQVGEMIACGLVVERVLLTEAMVNFGACACPKTVQEELFAV